MNLAALYEPDEKLRIAAPLLGVGVTLGSLVLAKHVSPTGRMFVAGWALLAATVTVALTIASIEEKRAA